MRYFPVPYAYDDEQCPKRGKGLNHTQNGSTTCTACGQTTYHRERPLLAKAKTPGPIPKMYRDEYWALIRDGLSDEEAQATICEHHGLERGEDQKAHWNLTELAALEFWRYRAMPLRVARGNLPAG